MMTSYTVAHDTQYHDAAHGLIATIPAGTRVIPASNLPEGGYWVESWPSMTPGEAGWQRHYGFLLQAGEVRVSGEGRT